MSRLEAELAVAGGILGGLACVAGWVLLVNRQLRRANGTKAWGK